MTDVDAAKEKIAKLLMLARDKGASENEAAVAMQFAMRMMLQHGLSEADFAESKEREYVADETGKKNEFDNRWQVIIAQAAGALYGCKAISYRSRYGQDYLKFVGRPDNVDAADMTHEFLCDQVERLYKINLPKGLSKQARAEYRRTFKEACSLRVHSRAKELMREMMANDASANEATGRIGSGTALVVQGHFEKLHKEVDAYMAKREVRMGRPMQMRSGNGTNAGYAAGNDVQLRKAVR